MVLLVFDSGLSKVYVASMHINVRNLTELILPMSVAVLSLCLVRERTSVLGGQSPSSRGLASLR